MKKTTLRHVGQSMAEGSFNFVRQIKYITAICTFNQCPEKATAMTAVLWKLSLADLKKRCFTYLKVIFWRSRIFRVDQRYEERFSC